jgi:hypothetical protein
MMSEQDAVVVFSQSVIQGIVPVVDRIHQVAVVGKHIGDGFGHGLFVFSQKQLHNIHPAFVLTRPP